MELAWEQWWSLFFGWRRTEKKEERVLGSSVEKRDGWLWWTASRRAPASLRPHSHHGRRAERGGSDRKVRRPPRERGGRGARRRGRGAASGTCPRARARPDEATAGELAHARRATAAELACTPARPGGRARGHLAASAAPRRQRFASLEREDAFLHRGWPPRQNACLVASSVGARISSEKHYVECIFAFAWRC